MEIKFKIPNKEARNNLILILANNGYPVWVEETSQEFDDIHGQIKEYTVYIDWIGKTD